MLMLATAPRPQDPEEFYYDSDDSVLDLHEEYLGLGEHIIEWQATQWGATPMPGWHPPNFGEQERSCYEKEPDLREIVNQARQARAAGNVPVQMVAPMPLPVASVRDWDRQCQQHFDQMVAKRQSSPLDGEQHKRARTPPQADPNDAPIWEHTQHEGCKDHDQGRSRTRHDVDRQLELDRARSKTRDVRGPGMMWSRVRSKSRRHSKCCKRSKSRRCSKSRRHSKSKACGGHEVCKPGVWPSQQAHSPSRGCPKEDRSCRSPSASSHSYKQTRNTGCATHLVPSKDEVSQFLKLKAEVVKWPQGYIQRRAKHIACSLTPDHEAVKCLVAFGENALKYTVEVLATVEWGTQHWKLQESFPVPPVSRWLRTPELIQTTMPLRGELLLIPSGAHLEDIHIHSPALWAWIAVLLQYWQDYMTRQLYGGCFRQARDLANTLIHDINPWLPHRVHFGWIYVAAHATLWLDMRDQFTRNTTRSGKARSHWCALLTTLSATLKWSTRNTSWKEKKTKLWPTVERPPQKSCHLIDRWPAQKGRPKLCPQIQM